MHLIAILVLLCALVTAGKASCVVELASADNTTATVTVLGWQARNYMLCAVPALGTVTARPPFPVATLVPILVNGTAVAAPLVVYPNGDVILFKTLNYLLPEPGVDQVNWIFDLVVTYRL